VGGSREASPGKNAELRANAGAITPGRTDGYGSAAERQLALGFRSLLSALLSLGLALHLRLPPDAPSRAHLPHRLPGALVSLVWVSSVRIPEDSHLLFRAHAGRTFLFPGTGAHIPRPFGPRNAPSYVGYSDGRPSLASVRPGKRTNPLPPPCAPATSAA
jgi:hypothetical protein